MPQNPTMKTSALTTQQLAHLSRIVNAFAKEASDKYVTGQIEHGGNLWEKPHMLDNAILEAIDLVIYLYTLREQSGR